MQDALSEVTQIFPPLKLRVFLDDITAIVKGRNKEVAEITKKKGDEKADGGSGEERPQFVSHRKW